jgi:Tfp pilus assembly protein PilN
VLINAIQEQQKTIMQLEERVKQLEGSQHDMESLKAEVSAIKRMLEHSSETTSTEAKKENVGDHK